MEMRRHQSFTLMEMLIVVALADILAAIALPVFVSTLESALESACAANRRPDYGPAVFHVPSSSR